MLQNAMDLAVMTSSMDEVNTEEPGWAMAAVTAMNQNGIAISNVDECHFHKYRLLPSIVTKNYLRTFPDNQFYGCLDRFLTRSFALDQGNQSLCRKASHSGFVDLNGC